MVQEINLNYEIQNRHVDVGDEKILVQTQRSELIFLHTKSGLLHAHTVLTMGTKTEKAG